MVNQMVGPRRCGNCEWFDGDDNSKDLCFCEIMQTDRPHWGFCPLWNHKKIKEEVSE